jgi:hypothetical protein
MFTITPRYAQQGNTHCVGSSTVAPTGGIHGSMPGFASTISL